MIGAKHNAFRAVWTAGVTTMVALLTLGAAYLWPAEEEAPPTPPAVTGPPRIMIVGDSITQGSRGDYTWRYRLYKQLEAAGVHTDFVGPRHDLHDRETGKGGSLEYADRSFDADHDAFWGRTLLEASTAISAEVRAAHPDYVVVLLGINDILDGASAEVAEDRMASFITNARNGNPNIRLVLGTPLPVNPVGRRPGLPAEIADYTDRITRLAGRSSTPTSPVRGAQTGQHIVPEEDLYDGLHPNTRGEIKIAAEIAYALAAGYGIGDTARALQPLSVNSAHHSTPAPLVSGRR